MLTGDGEGKEESVACFIVIGAAMCTPPNDRFRIPAINSRLVPVIV